jgi:hypothetical protein
MNRPCSALFAFLVASLLFFQPSYGQLNNLSNSAERQDKAELQEKAFKLLESLAGQLGSLQSAENRARMGSNIAGSLWPHDEQRARALFALVADDIKLGLHRPEDDPEPDETFYVFLKLRDDTAERIAQRDPELALSFLQKTEPVSDEPLPRDVLEKEQSMKLRLARRVATKNPEVAVKLARQSLANKLSSELLTLLIRVGSKDKQQAQALHREIVDKLRDSDITNYYPEWEFTQSLLRYFTPPIADEVTYREAVNLVINRALTEGCSKPRPAESGQHNSFCIYVGGLLPYIEKYLPAQAGRLKHWLPEQQPGGFVDITQAYGELNELSENGTVDEILALKSKYPEMEREVYRRAISKAAWLGDLERARKIAGDSGALSAAGSAPKVIREIPEEEIKTELEKLQKELPNLPIAQQVTTLLGAGMYIAPQDQKTALKLFKQADSIIYTLPAGKEQTRCQLMLAVAYCFAKDDRGFAIMESVLPKLNELIDAGAKLDGYDTGYLRDGEWNMTGKGTVGSMLTQLSESAGFFAWCDFDRAVSLTTQFERGEIRMMAQLKLAQGILAGPPRHLFGVGFRY